MYHFLGKKRNINELNFWQKKQPILEEFLGFFVKKRIFEKNLATSVFDP